ncbi:MAG TPA: PAS domain-containing protein, partial [Steroidobacteraceae bacterium]
MKSHTLFQAAMRASRLLACAALVAGVAVLAATLADGELQSDLAGLMTPQSALCAVLLALGSLCVGFTPRWCHSTGQALALLACGIAFGPLLGDAFGGWWSYELSAVPASAQAMLARLLPPGGDMAGATGIMVASTAVAVIFVPLRTRLSTHLFAAAASVGLLVMATSLIGQLLGSHTLASLGLDQAPTPLAGVLTGMLLLGTLAQRGDAGWLSALMSPSAAGSSARGVIMWTVLAPLALALLAIAGVRQGLYDLHFAFSLLAAATCCGLTAVVLWNAARVERAQQRAESARDAMQLAANRLRLAKSATGIQMWEWRPATREWISIDGAERLDPSANEYLEAGLQRTLRDGKSEFEFPVRRAGADDYSDERWMLATCWRELREREAATESIIVGITVDITERKLAALALETSETRLQLAACALPGFVYDWNCASGKMVRTSGLEQMLGYHGAEISPVSRWWEELVHPEDRALARPARVSRAAAADSDVESISCEYRVRHKNGNYVWIWDHCMLVRDRSGVVTR